jgi:hypothetical protein
MNGAISVCMTGRLAEGGKQEQPPVKSDWWTIEPIDQKRQEDISKGEARTLLPSSPTGQYHHYTDKKKRKLSSYIRKFRMKQLQSHIWLTASSYMGKYLRTSSYLKKPFLIYDFVTGPLWISLYMRKVFFSFLSVSLGTRCPISFLSWENVGRVLQFLGTEGEYKCSKSEG